MYFVFVVCPATTSYIIIYPPTPSEPPSCEASASTMYRYKVFNAIWIYLCIAGEGGWLQKLKQGCDAWETALTEWLDGNIISEESRRYVSNFISTYRLRPGGEDEDGTANPEDMVQDEAVYVTKDMLPEVLETRIGGKASRGDDLDLMGDSHHTP